MRLRSVSGPCFAYPRKRTRTATQNVFHSILFSADLGQVTNNSFAWNVSLPAYWTVQVSIEDANFNEGWSQAVRTVTCTTIPPPPFTTPLLHSWHSYLLCVKNHILDSSTTKQRRQLPTACPRCPPQRPRVSVKIDTPDYTPSFSTSNRSASRIYFVSSFLSFSFFPVVLPFIPV